MLRLIRQVVEDCRAEESTSVNCIWSSSGQFAASAVGVLRGGVSWQELQTDREVPIWGPGVLERSIPKLSPGLCELSS